MDKNIRVLFVGDPNLGPDSVKIIEKYFPDVTTVIWQKGDLKGRKVARKFIEEGQWDLTISQYNDFIFQSEHFDSTGPIINIHPSGPDLPGVGYDTYPLIREHKEHQTVVHFVKNDGLIDTGEIIWVFKGDLPPGSTYNQLRPKNQKLCLKALRRLLEFLNVRDDIASAVDELMKEANRTAAKWISANYVNYKILEDKLKMLHTRCPDHPVFQRDNLDWVPPHAADKDEWTGENVVQSSKVATS